jgi:hypothetical protein
MFIAFALIASSLSRGILHLRYNEKCCNARVAVFLKPKYPRKIVNRTMVVS